MKVLKTAKKGQYMEDLENCYLQNITKQTLQLNDIQTHVHNPIFNMLNASFK
jgi:hypothetical protein